MPAPRVALLILLVLLSAPHPGRAATLVATAAKDNTIYEDGVGGVNESNGQGDYLFAGRTGFAQVVRSLIMFDLTQIPTNAIVTSAQLTLTESTPKSDPQGVVNVHRVLADWGEGASDAISGEGGGAPAEPGDATWTHRFFDTDSWAVAGGDFDPTISASATVPPGGESTVVWSSALLAADVQAWVANPAQNFGWMLRRQGEFVDTVALRFDSKDNAMSNHTPTLQLEYSLALPGDYNGDGAVDAIDYAVWREAYQQDPGGLESTHLNGNGNGLAGVDPGDYLWWLNNYGAGAQAPTPVPTPMSAWLLAASLNVALRRAAWQRRTRPCPYSRRPRSG